jgi:hypothetical protein
VVIDVPSIKASGSPESGSNTITTAWWVGSGPWALPGKRLTSFAASPPVVGRYAGIAARKPRSGTIAAIRGGTDARSALTSCIASLSE